MWRMGTVIFDFALAAILRKGTASFDLALAATLEEGHGFSRAEKAAHTDRL